MTQAAHAEHLAEVIDMFEFCSPEERAVIEARRGRHNPRPRDWSMFAMANMSDARDSAALVKHVGGHPIAVHGVRKDGSCTCGKPHAGDDARFIGKHPISNGWQSEPLDLPLLDDTLRRRHELNLGWRMGLQPNGWRLVTVDVDGPLELLRPLEAKWGPLPPTLTAATGSGGRHLIYRLRDDAPEIRNRRGIAPKVDIRGEGGQIVIAPSRHHSGGAYRWLDAREPAVLP